jgi:phytoene synthase
MARDTSFSYSFFVLPAGKRQAVAAVWDFCRAVDDAVDEEPVRARAEAQLATWRAEVGRLFDLASAPATPQGQNLKPFVARFQLSRQPFDDLVDGVEMDLAHPRYETFDELTGYCRRVASAVGLICIEIFGCRGPEATDYAVNLGLALQITNIVRDVRGDLARGRVYLPREDLARFGCTEQDLAAGRVTPAVGRLLAFECERAREYYARAARAFPQSCARRLVAAEIMGRIYFEILRRIERADYDVFSSVIRVPKPVRARIALGVWIRSLLGVPGGASAGKMARREEPTETGRTKSRAESRPSAGSGRS